jgi:cytochrome c-type biogenesis protein CcmH/NrfF
MLKDLAGQIDQGKNDDSILAYFVDKYGVTVLSAPPASGFNLTAWAMPFVALGIGALVAIYFVRRFRAKWVGAPLNDAGLEKYQRRVEEELKTFTPED